MTDLPPVGRLVVVADEACHGGVVCILDGLDRWVARGAVIGVQGEERGGQHTALGGTGVNCAGL